MFIKIITLLLTKSLLTLESMAEYSTVKEESVDEKDNDKGLKLLSYNGMTKDPQTRVSPTDTSS